MKADILIRGGRVVDASNRLDGVMNVAISDGKILSVGAQAETVEARRTISADGCIVTAGLIDSHLHLVSSFDCGAVMPEGALFADGVTAAVDAGSRGILNYGELSQFVINRARANVKAMLGLSPTGVGLCFYYPENYSPKYFDRPVIRACIEAHRDEIVALKIRISRSILGELGLAPLREAVSVADEMGMPLVLHTTAPAGEISEICDMLRPGDVYGHAFAAKGRTILDENGRVRVEVKKARERGVIFDVANGSTHFGWDVAEPALREGFYPDTISSDLLPHSVYLEPTMSLPFLMSKYICAGMPLKEVLASVTWRAARVFGLEKEMGTLTVGSCADITVLRIEDRPLRFRDSEGKYRDGDIAIVPQMTIRKGRIVFRQVWF